MPVHLSYSQFVRRKIEFQFAVALFMEFDVEINLRKINDSPLNTEYYKKCVGINSPREVHMGDYCIQIDKFASMVRKAPETISEAVQPYIEELEEVESTVFKSGYLNIRLDKVRYFENICL